VDGGGRAVSLRRSRRVVTAAVGIAGCGLLCGCGAKQELLSMPAATQRVVVDLGGPPGAVLAPLYAGGPLGDFARAGLSVTLVPAADDAESLAAVASGTVDIGVASEPDLLAARARGEQLISIGALEQGPLTALISIPPDPIATVAGLAGKVVATDGTALSKAELDTMLRSAGVEASSVRTTDGTADPGSQLKSHAAAATLGGQWNSDAVELGLEHHTPTVIRIERAGVPTFNRYVLVVRLSEARDRGELLRTFLQALTQTVHAEQAAPASAVAALLNGAPGLDGRFELASLEATLPALDPPGSGNPFGYQNPLAWRTFDAWMLTNGLVTVSSDAALAVDNEFLPGEGE
jgi:ABC-type nitrate/sulfonate/bicarbonate transport system substrate-binding protein